MDKASEGESMYFSSSPLRVFSFKGITIGGLICNDLWANPTCTPYPDCHLSQQLSQMGARIIFHAVNGWRDNSDYCRFYQKNFHESNLIMRAAAGKLWIVSVDSAFPEDFPVSSPGGIISPTGKWVERVPDTGERYFCLDVAM